MLLNRKVNARIGSAGVLALGTLLGAAVLPPRPATAGSITAGVNPPPAPSTPSCGLEKTDYPDCPTASDDERIAQGFAIAPVGLDLTGLDPKKVGIGSYWMNSAGNCSGCHASHTLGNNGSGGQYTSDGNPQQLPVNFSGGTYAYASVINPYNPPAIINAADSAGGGGCGTEVIARNLTPDWATGAPLPEGNTLENFKKTLRTGHDFQQANLNCPPIGNGTPPSCLNAPSDGTKLAVMPWPALSVLTDYDLEAMYAYLTAIPCIANTGSQYPQIIHTCPSDPQANHHRYTYSKGQLTRRD